MDDLLLLAVGIGALLLFLPRANPSPTAALDAWVNTLTDLIMSPAGVAALGPMTRFHAFEFAASAAGSVGPNGTAPQAPLAPQVAFQNMVMGATGQIS